MNILKFTHHEKYVVLYIDISDMSVIAIEDNHTCHRLSVREADAYIWLGTAKITFVPKIKNGRAVDIELYCGDSTVLIEPISIHDTRLISHDINDEEDVYLTLHNNDEEYLAYKTNSDNPNVTDLHIGLYYVSGKLMELNISDLTVVDNVIMIKKKGKQKYNVLFISYLLGGEKRAYVRHVI